MKAGDDYVMNAIVQNKTINRIKKCEVIMEKLSSAHSRHLNMIYNYLENISKWKWRNTTTTCNNNQTKFIKSNNACKWNHNKLIF